MKFGEVVKYDAGEVDQIAFVTGVHTGTKLDLLTFNAGGTGSVKKEVPRRDEGGGHTWKPA